MTGTYDPARSALIQHLADCIRDLLAAQDAYDHALRQLHDYGQDQLLDGQVTALEHALALRDARLEAARMATRRAEMPRHAMNGAAVEWQSLSARARASDDPSASSHD